MIFTRRTIMIIALAIILVPRTPFLFAETEQKNPLPSFFPFIFPQTQTQESNSENNSTTSQSSATSSQNTRSTPTSTDEISSSDSANATNTAPVGTTTQQQPATTTAPEPEPGTTTPHQATTTAPIPRAAPRNGDPTSPTLELILNQIVQPRETPPEPAEPKVKDIHIRETPKSTPVQRPARATTTATTTATTSTIGLVAPVDGSSNEFTPLNYYIPLDNLSTETTYGLSAIALLLGIAGAALVMKDTREYQEVPQPEWAANFRQEPLLEQ